MTNRYVSETQPFCVTYSSVLTYCYVQANCGELSTSFQFFYEVIPVVEAKSL